MRFLNQPRFLRHAAMWLRLFPLLLPAASWAQSCPDIGQTSRTAAPKLTATKLDPSKPVDVSADNFEGDLLGNYQLSGNVEMDQGKSKLFADAVSYNTSTQNIKANGTVKYEDEQFRVSGGDAEVNSNVGATFDDASFELIARAARGTANKMQVSANGDVSLKTVTYTSCPADHEDWVLKAATIDIDQDAKTGTGRNVRLTFKGVPILYTPYLSFPVGNERKSGVLFPTFGSSSRGGEQFTVPWYWNIAPNYDATFSPSWFSSRGAALDTEFRYELAETSKGTVLTGYLPYDQVLDHHRDFVQANLQQDFSRSLRLNVDAGNVGDNKWFEDFGQGRDATSAIYLTRFLNLRYLNDGWQAALSFQNLQMIDSSFLPGGVNRPYKPYSVAPQLNVHGEQAQWPYGVDFIFNGELNYFERGDVDPNSNVASVTGARLHLAPELRMPLRGNGIYIEPAAGWRFTAYRLSDLAAGANASPSVSAPVLSVDSGLIFERYSGARQQRLYTLEPRLLYLYVPYRDQSDIPVFDTALPDLNLVELFRTDRYVGEDRLGDANQLSVGVTSRMFDSHSGQQFLSGTVGQAFYFTQPRVLLPNETPLNRNSSDVIAQIMLSAYKNWNVSMGVQWDPSAARSQRGDARFQYIPAKDRVINVGYSYQRLSNTTQDDGLEQWTTSFAWPIGPTWSTYGKVVYSRVDEKIIERFAGFQYRSCCWNVRLVAGRAISTRGGTEDTSIRLQLELSGLSSVGVAADTFLERSIPGYSVR